MRKINYSDRANFEEFSSEDTDFIKNLTHKYKFSSVLEIPCSNGRNLSILSNSVQNAYFGDINRSMVHAVQDKISKFNYCNCKAMVLDLCDLSNLPFAVDAVLIMQQSFQMISHENAKRALQNLKKANCRWVVIDIYDFNSTASDYPQFLKSYSSFTDAQKRKWQRQSKIIDINKNKVHIIHNYTSYKLMYLAELELFNYSREELIVLCEECEYTILHLFTDYTFGTCPQNGRTIIILENKNGDN